MSCFCSGGDAEPVIENACVPVIYFDGIMRAEVIDGNLRMVAYRRKSNPVTGRIEREPVAEFVRPASQTIEIYGEISAAMRRACRETIAALQ